MPNPTFQRRSRHLVDPQVQGGVLRKVMIHWALLFVCNTVGLMIWLRLFENPEAGWGETFTECVQRYFPFFVISIALIPAFVWDTLKLTNRFAGPVMRLRTALADAYNGRPVQPLHFRQGDYWAELAEHFNHLLSRAQQGTTTKTGDPS